MRFLARRTGNEIKIPHQRRASPHETTTPGESWHKSHRVSTGTGERTGSWRRCTCAQDGEHEHTE